jgi:two-component system nitrogen regulation response regulator NtrX
MVEKDVIDESDIPEPFNPGAKEGKEPVEAQLFIVHNLKEAKKAFEKEYIQRKLLQNNNNVTKTAKAIGVDRSYLHKKLKSLNGIRL